MQIYEDVDCINLAQSMGFLGDQVVEFFLWNNTIMVKICSLDHLLKSIIVSKFSKVLSDFSQILKSNETYFNLFLPVFWLSKVTKTLWTSSLD